MIILLVWFVGWFITAILLSRSLAEDGFGGKYTPNVTEGVLGSIMALAWPLVAIGYLISFVGGFGRR